MTGFRALFARYVIRDLTQTPLRTLLTVLGVALGISVVVAVHLSNDRAIGSFNQSIEVMSGGADLQILANGSDLDEKIFEDLSWLWSLADLSPLVEGRARVAGTSVKIIGVDLVSEGPFREYISSDGRDVPLDISRGGFLDLLTKPGNILLPESFARDLSVGLDSEIEVLAATRLQRFTVGALLQDQGAGRAFGGKVLFMDIATAQEALDRLGVLDRIDLVLRPGVEIQPVIQRLRETLPANAVLYRPEDLSNQSERMLRGFRFNLTALSYLSLIVGVILVYNTLNISVVRRQREVAALRTLGTTRQTVFALLLSEAALLGMAGAAGGIALGWVLSNAAEALIRRTVENLYTGGLSDFDGGFAAGYFLIILSVGTMLGVLSGWFPARRATDSPPVEIMRQGFLTSETQHSGHRAAALSVLLLVLSGVLSLGPPVSGVPLLGYVSSVALMGAFVVSAKPLSQSMLRLLRRWSQLFSIEVRLALQTVEGGLGRLIVAVTSLMIAVAMLVAVATMVGSFRETVIVWIDQTLSADLYVRPAGAGAQDWSTTIESGTVDILTQVPGVSAVGRFRGRPFAFGGGEATLAGGDFDVLARKDRLIFLDGRTTEDVAAKIASANSVVITEPFSLRYGIEAGESIAIPTPAGQVEFHVEAVYFDYSSDRGIVVMDRERYIHHFGDDSSTSLSIFLEDGVDSGEMLEFLRSSPAGRGLQVFRNGDLKSTALRVFDQTFRITYALELIAIVVAVLGITNTLAALLLERRAEIALLRFLGASKRQIRSMAILESGAIGVLGSGLGAILGMVLSLILIFVINRQSFGWTIQFYFPAQFVLASLGVIILSTLLAGAYPASQAARTDPIRSLRAE